MGIKFLCPNGHKLHVKSFLASQRGVCPHCGEKFMIPAQSIPDIRVESLGVKESRRQGAAGGAPSVDVRAAAAAAITLPEPYGEQPAADLPTPDAAAPVGGAADAIAEAPAAVWYVRIASGEQFGPAPGDTMRRWLVEGRVAADALVWREGWAEWNLAAKVFPRLNQPIGPPEVDVEHLSAFEKGLDEQVQTLVTPAQTIPDASALSSVVLESDGAKSSVFEARRKTAGHSRTAIIALAVVVLILIPVVLYVLMRQ